MRLKKYRYYDLIEMKPRQWFHYFSIENQKDGQWYDAFLLRLPIWGYGHDIYIDSERWGQRVLRWHGKSGFSMAWYFEEPVSSISVTPDVTGIEKEQR